MLNIYMYKMVKYFTPLQIHYVSTAIGNFRLKDNIKDNHILEGYRHKVRQDMAKLEIPDDKDPQKIADAMYIRLHERFLKMLVVPHSSTLMDAGADIMAPLIQEVLNSHKNAGGKKNTSAAREILTGTLNRSDEYLVLRLNNVPDDDSATYNKVADDMLKNSHIKFKNLMIDSTMTAIKRDDVPYIKKLERYYNIHKQLCYFSINLLSIIKLSITPLDILEMLRNKLGTAYTVFFLHRDDIVDFYVSSDISYITTLMNVRNILLDTDKDDADALKFTHYEIEVTPLEKIIKNHYADMHLGYVLDIHIQNSDITEDFFIEKLESAGASIHAYIRDEIGTLVRVRYQAASMVNLDKIYSHRIKIHGPSIQFYNISDKYDIDMHNSYTNNIYVMSDMFGIICLAPYFTKEWSEYNSTQNHTIYLSAFMFTGRKILPIKQSSIAEEGPISALGEDAKGNLRKMALVGASSHITTPQAAVATGLALKTCGTSAVVTTY